MGFVLLSKHRKNLVLVIWVAFLMLLILKCTDDGPSKQVASKSQIIPAKVKSKEIQQELTNHRPKLPQIEAEKKAWLEKVYSDLLGLVEKSDCPRGDSLENFKYSFQADPFTGGVGEKKFESLVKNSADQDKIKCLKKMLMEQHLQIPKILGEDRKNLVRLSLFINF